MCFYTGNLMKLDEVTRMKLAYVIKGSKRI